MWVFRIMLITIPAMTITGWTFYRWGYKNGVKDENWRWRTDINLSKLPYSGLFDKQ